MICAEDEKGSHKGGILPIFNLPVVITSSIHDSYGSKMDACFNSLGPYQ